jgi:enoyl-CoA hydratase/carnithine racemase
MNVLARTESRIGVVELARPDKKNAITAEMYGQLAEALTAADANPQVRAILLHGTAECFTAGNDLSDFLERPPTEGSATVWRFFEVLPQLKKPIVAAVGGPAVGIGTTLLLHCDLVYAAPNARFQLPFVQLGIVPEFASTFLLPLIAGYQRAAELVLLGQPFSAQKAHEAGIVTEVVPQEKLLERAREAAHALAALPPESIRLTKQLMKKRYGQAVGETIAEEGRIFRERLASPEAQEAMTAFLEKRKPDFSRF